MTAQELQSLRNMGNEAEAAADEIQRLRAALADGLALVAGEGKDDMKDAAFWELENAIADAPRSVRDEVMRLRAELRQLKEALLECKTCALPTEVRDLVNSDLRA